MCFRKLKEISKASDIGLPLYCWGSYFLAGKDKSTIVIKTIMCYIKHHVYTKDSTDLQVA